MKPPAPYAQVFAHVDTCARCQSDLVQLCDVGRELRDTATQVTTGLLAAIPPATHGPKAKA